MLRTVSWRWYLAGLVCGLALLGVALQAWSLPNRYTLTAVGPVNPATCHPPQITCIGAHAVAIADDAPVVVGNVQNVNSDFTPYEFSPTDHELPGMDGTFFTLTPPTHRVNTGGFAEAAAGTRIVGEVTRPGSSNTLHAVLWDEGTVTDVEAESGILLPSSAAEAVNADDVCGSADNIPACWLSGVFVTLPTLSPEPDKAGAVTALNDHGNAAGWSVLRVSNNDLPRHCAYWPVTGGVVDCHSDVAGTDSKAEDMNNQNQIVGSGTQRGFLVLPWGMILLPPFGDLERSAAHGINDLGLIVGTSASPTRRVATVWENGVPLDLQPRLVEADGWTLTGAVAINNAGLIVATAAHPTDGHTVVLLTPVQDPVAAWYAWRYQILRYYQARYDRWRKQIAQYYFRNIGR